jgi:hypothetical protein
VNKLSDFMSPGELAKADQIYQQARNSLSSLREVIKNIAIENPELNSLELAFYLSIQFESICDSGKPSTILAAYVVEDFRKS